MYIYFSGLTATSVWFYLPIVLMLTLNTTVFTLVVYKIFKLDSKDRQLAKDIAKECPNKLSTGERSGKVMER
jgi:hypothetical protein